MLGGFNVWIDVDACDCTWRLYKQHKSVCSESWLGEKSLAAQGNWTPVSIAPGCLVRRSTNWAVPPRRWKFSQTKKSLQLQNICSCWIAHQQQKLEVYSVINRYLCTYDEILKLWVWVALSVMVGTSALRLMSCFKMWAEIIILAETDDAGSRVAF